MTLTDITNRRSKRWRQQRLHELNIDKKRYENIDPSGDPMPERINGDGIIRYGYQNIRGSEMNRGLQLATEVDMMADLGVNVQGLSEANKPWTEENKSHYDHMMGTLF